MVNEVIIATIFNMVLIQKNQEQLKKYKIIIIKQIKNFILFLISKKTNKKVINKKEPKEAALDVIVLQFQPIVIFSI